MSIAVITHNDCLGHEPGSQHPEHPNRLRVINNELRASFLANELSFIDAPLGRDEDILLAHREDYLQQIRATAPEKGLASLDADTIMSPGSLRAALRGVGAATLAVDLVREGSHDTVFCAVRPPGHHATVAQAMGFCIFNNAAIAALYAQQQGFPRVALVDFDVHHGNGSQDILTGKPDILFISTHQSPLYPGTGSLQENYPGNILNVPLRPGTRGPRYQATFEQEVLPALRDFAPDLLVISAGFDAHAEDPLAGLGLEQDDYNWIGGKLRDVAAEHCDGRSISFLEGGYNLDVLGSSVLAFLDGLAP